MCSLPWPGRTFGVTKIFTSFEKKVTKMVSRELGGIKWWLEGFRPHFLPEAKDLLKGHKRFSPAHYSNVFGQPFFDQIQNAYKPHSNDNGKQGASSKGRKIVWKSRFWWEGPTRGGGNGDLVRSHHREARSGFAENCGTVPLSYMEQREQVGWFLEPRGNENLGQDTHLWHDHCGPFREVSYDGSY